MGHIYLYSGDGAGKTANALGLALRALGHKQRVVIIQFLKWKKDTGEMLFKHDGYEIYQVGRVGWHGFKNLTDEDKLCIVKGLLILQKRMENPNVPDLLILDELNLAVYLKLIDARLILKSLRRWMRVHPNMNVVFTGRHATPELYKGVDFVNEIVAIKAPRRLVCKRGIQY